jgi:crossover junction endodeoxyribonuclease RusA
MALILHLTLPWPPSVNHCYAQVGNRRYLTPEAKRYKKDVSWLIKCQARSQSFDKFSQNQKLQAFIQAYPPDCRKRDEDNIKKILYDTLTLSGIIHDDSLIKRATTDFMEFDKKKRGHIELYLAYKNKISPIEFIKHCSKWT